MAIKHQEIKQKIISILVLVVMLVMVFSVLKYSKILADSSVTMSQTVSGGTLSLSTVSSFTMNDVITVGVSTASQGNLIVVNVLDYRGTGAGWTAAMYASNWNQVARESGTNNLSNAATSITPGTLGNYNSASHTGIDVGPPDQFLDAPRTLFNASTNNGMGAYFLGNSGISLDYGGDPTLRAGAYQATSTITIT